MKHLLILVALIGITLACLSRSPQEAAEQPGPPGPPGPAGPAGPQGPPGMAEQRRFRREAKLYQEINCGRKLLRKFSKMTALSLAVHVVRSSAYAALAFCSSSKEPFTERVGVQGRCLALLSAFYKHSVDYRKLQNPVNEDAHHSTTGKLVADLSEKKPLSAILFGTLQPDYLWTQGELFDQHSTTFKMKLKILKP
uniref:C1q domain-containing protein n=1 Tax=Angiostrongylus cantonensis TaxID=6313 RepID=A0A0K0CY65_ANGCA